VVDRYAVIGNPVAHSKSPWIHEQFARACGEDMEYGAIEAPPDGFVAAVEKFRGSGGKGLNVTLPFKEQAFRYCAVTSERAAAAYAANTLILDREKPFGDNTDGVGLVRDLTVNLGRRLAGAQRYLRPSRMQVLSPRRPGPCRAPAALLRHGMARHRTQSPRHPVSGHVAEIPRRASEARRVEPEGRAEQLPSMECYPARPEAATRPAETLSKQK